MAKKNTSALMDFAVAGAAAYGIVTYHKARKAVEAEATRFSYKEPFELPAIDNTLRYHVKWAQYDNKQMIKDIMGVLNGNHIKSCLESITQGPSFSRIEIKCKDANSYKKLMKLRIEFQMIFNRNDFEMYGKGDTVYIDLPIHLTTVRLGDLIKDSGFTRTDGTTFAIGMTVDKKCFFEDVEDMPHLLIAGTTGSGKTVLMHDLIISVLMKHGPKDVELYLIDPKETEFHPYRALGYCHVESNPSAATSLLNRLCAEMDDRYAAFSRAGVVDLKSYNEKYPDQRMPRKIVFIDELADLMTSSMKKSVETFISRLAAKARAAGIHLVIATQYPTVKVITGQIKANIPARIALHVATAVNSRVILDQGGAEKLQKHGDLYYMNGDEPIRLQAAFIERSEINNVLYYLQQNQYDAKGIIGKTPTTKVKKERKPMSKFKKTMLITAAAIFALCLLGNMKKQDTIDTLVKETGFTRAEVESIMEWGDEDTVRYLSGAEHFLGY